MKKIIPLLAFVASCPAVAGSVDSMRDDDAIATCLVTKQDGDQDVGPKLLLGWQFDAKLRGSVPIDAVRYHDPNYLLEHRAFREINYDSDSIQFVLQPSEDNSNGRTILLVLVRSGADAKMFNLSVSKTGAIDYFGTCKVQSYQSGSNAMFQALQSIDGR